MKIAFFGTGNFSKNILKSILNFENIEVCLVVSQPDKPVGRKKILEKTPIKLLSEEASIECLQPEKLKNNLDFLKKLESLELDFIVVVAYGKIISKEMLETPKYGCINLHGSILPKYRGASPIQEALKNGDEKTGLTVMYMSEGMDEGDILKIEEIDVGKIDKTSDVFKKFEQVGPSLLLGTLKNILEKSIKGTSQNNSFATYCSKILKQDGKVDFYKETSEQIYNKFRAYNPWPGIYTFYDEKKLGIENCEIYTPPLAPPSQEGDRTNYPLLDGDLKHGEVIKIDKKTIGVVCFDKKVLILREVKLEGKKSMDILSFINGNKNFIGSKL